jgi:siroheme synthase
MEEAIMLYPYNHKMGQRIQTDADGVAVDRAFLAHLNIAAEDAVAASSDGVHAAMNLAAEVQSITTGITNPAVPRNIRIDGNVSGINGKVKIYGTNYAGDAITEEIQANGITAVDGNLAFRTVTKIDLPIQNHTPAAQSETIQVTAGCSEAGDIAVAVTAAALGDDSPVSVTVTLTTDDNTAAEVAAKIMAELNADETISAVFTATVTGEDSDTVTLTAKAPAANDDTLAIAVTAGSTGVTVGSSTNGTAGVPYDQISVGWGDKFGLPYKLYADELVFLKLFDKSADTGTVTADADELEKNVFDPNGSPDGEKDIDLYIVV